MPPKEDGTPRAFTWITGDPRSRQNVTQIRRHAGQNPGSRATTSLSASADNNQASSVHGRVYLTPAPVVSAQPQGTTASSNPSEQASTSSVHVVYPATRPPEHVASASTDMVQVQYPITRPPERKAPASITTKAPTRRLAINDLVNHVDEQARVQAVLEPTAATTVDDAGTMPDETAAASSEASLRHAVSRSTAGKQPADAVRGHKRVNDQLATEVLQANTSKRRRRVPSSSFQITWRPGVAPFPSLPLSQDDSQVEEVLLRTNAFYTGTFESTWSQRLQQDSTVFDIISSVETFSGSITLAAGLVAVNRIDAASSLLDRVLPTIQQLLTSPHPQLYYALAELSLDTSHSHLGHLRAQVKQFAADVSESVLGTQHPITQLLRLSLPDTAALRLRDLIQAEIHTLYKRLFGTDAYQTTCHEYFLARILSQLGRHEEATRILSALLTRWETTYGADSLMCVTAQLELAKVHLAQSQEAAASSAEAESLVRDALRRTFRVQANSRQRPLSAGILHSRIGCLRTLGLVHSMRNDHGSALEYYARAVEVGVDDLGSEVPATQLALADLDVASRSAAQADTLGGKPGMGADKQKELLSKLSSINITGVN